MAQVPGLLKKCTERQQQKWEEDEERLLNSPPGHGHIESNDLRRQSPGRSKDQRVRSKSPASNRIHPESPAMSAESGELMFTVATHPLGILKSGITCIHEAHVPRSKDEGVALQYDWNSMDLSSRPDEFNRGRTTVSSGRQLTFAPNHKIDRGSSTGASNDTSSSKRRTEASSRNSRSDVASSSSEQIERLARRNLSNELVQSEPADDPIMRRSKKVLSVAFDDTNTVGPPPPCSLCNNEHHSGKPSSLRFSSEKLRIVTDCYSSFIDFDEELYKGSLTGLPVSVSRRVSQENSEFCSEVDILKDLQHPNIVNLRGFCDEDESQALVFNFVCNRNLFFNLSSKNMQKTMPWTHRMKLAVDLARGLDYLHKSGIIHGNVNSKNVFVTHDFVPVIGDFSCSRRAKNVRDVILPKRSGDTKSRGYLAPDYIRREKHSEQQDVYAFGVILFELISGRAPFDRSYLPRYLDRWARATLMNFEPHDRQKLIEMMADPRLNFEFSHNEMLRMILVAKRCISENRNERPEMEEVMNLLLSGNSNTLDIKPDIERIQKEPTAEPAPSNQQHETSRRSSLVVQNPPENPVVRGRLPSSYYDQNAMRILQMPLRILRESATCVGGDNFHLLVQDELGDEPQLAASPKRNRDRVQSSASNSTRAPVKKPPSEKTPFTGHPDREARRMKKSRSSRPQGSIDGYSLSKPRSVSTRRPQIARRPATPGHRLAKGKSGTRTVLRTSDEFSAPSTPKSHQGYASTSKPVFRYYNRKNPGKIRDAFAQRKEDRLVRFAQPKFRNTGLFKFRRLD